MYQFYSYIPLNARI